MRALEFIRDHVTFKLPYNFSYQMKNPKVFIKSFRFLLTFIGLSGVILQGVYLDLNLLTHGQKVPSFIFMGQRNLFSIQYLKTL